MKKYIFIFLTLLLTNAALAQEKYFYVNLDVMKPLSNTNWISDVSARGGKAGYRVFINDRFSAGVDVSWTQLDQYKPTETYYNATGAITTDYFKYMYSYSAAASGQYNFKLGDGETFFPYAGLGLGAMRNEYVLYYNIYEDTEASWGFLARPEAGILLKFGKRRSLGAMAAIHYDYATNKSDRFDYNNFSAIGFQIGIAFISF